MNSHDYATFTERLAGLLAARPDVIGLVALGSMARADYQPDRWSDHDFFVVVDAGAQEDYRTDLSWLPDRDRIVLSYRETAHGLKVLYDNAHLLEFAVFDAEELAITRINRYRVLLDRERIAARMEAVRDATLASISHSTSDAVHLGQILTILLVGTGRYRRGERLSGHHFVRFASLYHLVPMLVRHTPAERRALLDNLDPFRRFDIVFSQLGEELDRLLLLPVPEAALGLLDLAERLLAAKVADFPRAAFDTVRAAIAAP